MQPNALIAQTFSRASNIPAHWRQAGAQLALVWAVLVVAFLPDWLAMFSQWWNISTYNHVLLVPPILAWLVWLRAPQLAELQPKPCRWGLAAFAVAVFVWMLGAFAGFNLLRQVGAVAMLPASALLLLGPRCFLALLFPLGYMAFLVPFGDELVPPLQTITAKLTVALVHLTQVSAAIDGVFIDTPAGLFEVAEACSGVKFLIAMIALGALVGNVCFVSWRRRAAFFALCLVVPILANGVRAWGTIYVAQYVGAEKAAGVDHIIYGWIFFAVVIAAVLGVSWRYFDRPADQPVIDPARIAALPWLGRIERAVISLPLALVMGGLIALGGVGWAQAADALAAPMPRQVFLPEVPSWHRADYRPASPWQPLAGGANHRLLGRYADATGNEVDVFYALYAGQGEDSEAGGFGQGAVPPESGWAWTSPGPAMSPAKVDRLLWDGRNLRLAATYYRSGALLTGSNARLKLVNIGDRLLLRARPTALLILSAEARPGHDPAAALAAFRSAIGDPGPWMDRIGEAR